MPSLRAHHGRSPLLWVLFGLSGRVSRRVYWLSYGATTSIQSAVLAQLLPEMYPALFGGAGGSYQQLAAAVGPVVLLVTFYSQIAAAVKRLHDVGYSGALAVAFLLPVVNLASTIWIGILPGTPGPNRFGAAKDTPPA